MAVKNLIRTVRDTLFEVMAADERVIVLGEDVGRHGGVFGATEGFYDAFGEARVIDTPLAESAIVGVAIGAAAGGLLPVAEIQFADFIHSAVDQIINEAAKIRYRSNNDYQCPIVIRAPYGAGIRGGLYHSQSVESLFMSTAGLKIVAPATPYDVKGLLRAAIYDPDPVLFFEHKRLYRSIKGEVPETPYTLPIGQAEVKRAGTHLTVISYGLMLHYALQAADELAREAGVEAEVVDLRTLRPLDEATILASVKKTGKVLIIHEDNKVGGIGNTVAALIAEEAFFYLDAPIRRIGMPDVPATPFSHVLEDAVLPNQQQIKTAMLELARF